MPFRRSPSPLPPNPRGDALRALNMAALAFLGGFYPRAYSCAFGAIYLGTLSEAEAVTAWSLMDAAGERMGWTKRRT